MPAIIPGAFGDGITTRGAYGGGSDPDIYRITSLLDSGTGTLREALEATGPRVVIFETSGTIVLTDNINVVEPYLTVAGQTAPSPGITVKGGGINVLTHDVVNMHYRIRPGDGGTPLESTADHDATESYGTDVYNVVWAYMSFSWAGGKLAVCGSLALDAGVTYWRCIFSEALYRAANVFDSGGWVGGQVSSLALLIKQSYVNLHANVTVAGCLFAHNGDRHPEAAGPVDIKFINNLIYDWGNIDQGIYPWAGLVANYDGDTTGPKIACINNYYRAGTVPHVGSDKLYAFGSYAVTGNTQLYMSGNKVDQFRQAVGLFQLISGVDPRVGSNPLDMTGTSAISGDDVPDFVLAHAGARPADRDAVDARIVADVLAYTGHAITSQSEVGGWPSLAVNTRSLTTPGSPHTVLGSGYTALEEWIQNYSSDVEVAGEDTGGGGGEEEPPPPIVGDFTKLYLTNRTAPYSPATFRGSWDATGSAVTKALVQDPVAPPFEAAATTTVAEVTATTDWDVLLYRGVSGPLAAQTLSGTVNLTAVVGEANADADYAYHVHIYATQGDSDTPRGTILTNYIEAAGNEWPVPGTGRAFASAQALSSLAVQNGDRLVVEIGYRSRNSHTTSRNGIITYGRVTGNDLTPNTTTGDAFLAFSNAIAIGSAVIPTRVTQIVSEALIRANVTGGQPTRVSQLVSEALIGVSVPTRLSQFVVEALVQNLAEPEVELPPTGYVGLTWVEFLDRVLDMHVWSKVDLADPVDYYYGFKEARVKSWGTIVRAMSDRTGSPQSSSFTFVLSDADHTIRGLLADPETRYFTNTPITVRSIDDDRRRLLETPRTIFKGVIDQYRPLPDLLFDFRALDPVSKRFASQDGTRLPQRRINSTDFPDAPVNSLDLGVPIIYGPLTDDIADSGTGGGTGGTSTGPVEVRAPGGVPGGWWPYGLGLNDPEMGTQYAPGFSPDVQADGTFWPGLDADHRSWRKQTGAPEPPTAPDADTAGGGSLPDDWRGGPARYSFFITSMHNGIESDPSPVVMAEAGPSAAGQQINLSWTAPTVAPNQGYRVYCCDNPFYTSSKFSTLSTVDGKAVMIGSTFVRMLTVAAGTTSTSFTSLTDGDNANFERAYIYRITAILATGESPASGEILGVSHPYKRPLQLRWRTYEGALGYRIYRRSGNSGSTTFDRTIDVDVNGIDGIKTIDGETQVRWFDDFDDAATGVTVGNAPPPGGVYKPIYVGTETIGGVTYYRWLAAGHACKLVGNAYLGGTRVAAGRYGVDVFVPGKTGYPHPTTYVDINSRRYTIVYLTGQAAVEAIDDTKPLTLNIDGVESIGNGLGELITDGLEQYRHFVKNFVIQNYQGGTWLATPFYADEPGLAMMNEASFTAAREQAAARLTGGYPGAWVCGINGEQVTLTEMLGRLNTSFDVSNYNDRRMRFAISMEPETPTTTLTGLDDTSDIFKQTFAIEDRQTEHFNQVPYYYKRDYSGRTRSFSIQSGQTIELEGGWLARATSQDDNSIDPIVGYGQTKRRPDLNLWCVTSAAVANNVAQHVLARSTHPPRYAKFDVGPNGMNYEIGDIVPVTHHEGVGADGWTAQPIRITGISSSPNDFTTTLEGYDVSFLT